MNLFSALFIICVSRYSSLITCAHLLDKFLVLDIDFLLFLSASKNGGRGCEKVPFGYEVPFFVSADIVFHPLRCTSAVLLSFLN